MGSFLLGPLSCWGLLRLGLSLPVDRGCRGGWAAELQEVGPQGPEIQPPELEGRQTLGHLGQMQSLACRFLAPRTSCTAGISDNDGELSKKTLSRACLPVL